MTNQTTNNGPVIRVDCRACGSTHNVAPYASGFYSSDADFCLEADCGSGNVEKTMLLSPAVTHGCAGCGSTDHVRNNVCGDCEFILAENMISPVGISRESLARFFHGDDQEGGS